MAENSIFTFWIVSFVAVWAVTYIHNKYLARQTLKFEEAVDLEPIETPDDSIQTLQLVQ